MKYKKKTKVPKKLTEEEISIIRENEWNTIKGYLCVYNLYKRGNLCCDIYPLIIVDGMIKDKIITQEDIDNNMIELENRLNSGEYTGDILNEYNKIYLGAAYSIINNPVRYDENDCD